MRTLAPIEMNVLRAFAEVQDSGARATEDRIAKRTGYTGSLVRSVREELITLELICRVGEGPATLFQITDLGRGVTDEAAQRAATRNVNGDRLAVMQSLLDSYDQEIAMLRSLEEKQKEVHEAMLKVAALVSKQQQQEQQQQEQQKGGSE